MAKSKFIKIKIEIGDLFTDMFECSQFLDENDVAKITDLKNLFYENIKYPALFGRVKLRNEEYFKSIFEKLNKKIPDKINELSSYIEYIDNI